MATQPVRIDGSSTEDGIDSHSGGGTAIYKKLLLIMNDVAYIQKDKRNEFHKYNYASEAAIKEKLHEAMVDHGVLFLPQIIDVSEREIVKMKDGKPSTSETLTTIKTVHRFVDVETGQYIEGQSYGTGIDSADKGLYKAIAGAIKYIMTSTFLISTGDDPEDDGKTNSKEAAKKVADQKLAGMAAGKSYQQVSKEIADKLGDDPDGEEKERLCNDIRQELKDSGLGEADKRDLYKQVMVDCFGDHQWSRVAHLQTGVLMVGLDKLRAFSKQRKQFAVPAGFPVPFEMDKSIAAFGALKGRLQACYGSEIGTEEYSKLLQANGSATGKSNAFKSPGPAMRAYAAVLDFVEAAEKKAQDQKG